MDREDRVLVAERPAAVDHLLAAPLDLGVVALHGREVEILGRRALGERARGTPTESDQKRRTAKHDQRGAIRHLRLLDVTGAHRADTARQHHRLVITTHHTARFEVLVRPEVAEDRGAPELVVERGRSNRAIEHDVERGRDARWRADPLLRLGLPRLECAGDPEVGDRETDEPRLWLAAAAGRALVADLATGAGRGARERRDRGRVIVGLDLAEDVHWLENTGVDVIGLARKEPHRRRALDDRGVVLVRRQRAARARRVRLLDHLEERRGLLRAIDEPLRVEDLVATVLAVRLREHHQLDVRGIAAKLPVALHEVLDLVVGKREAEARARGAERGLAIRAERHEREGPRLARGREHLREIRLAQDHALGHPIRERRTDRSQIADARDRVRDRPLDPRHRGEAADMRDVGRLR